MGRAAFPSSKGLGRFALSYLLSFSYEEEEIMDKWSYYVSKLEDRRRNVVTVITQDMGITGRLKWEVNGDVWSCRVSVYNKKTKVKTVKLIVFKFMSKTACIPKNEHEWKEIE